ncbi:MAG: hypothetical protein ACRC2H_01275 [Silanimonas sp.]
MSLRGGEIRQLAIGDGWVHAVHSAPAAPAAALVFLPAFFHEAQRSHRLFAVLADALVRRGVACLRIDYRGTGDASGDDSGFLPSRAIEDAVTAARAMQAMHALRPVLLGVRAGALLAEAAASRLGLAWWAWQPVEDGRKHLATLRERDRFELNNRLRFPFLGSTRRGRDDQLMGQRLHPEFALELGILRRGAAPALRVDASIDEGPEAMPLAPELADWVDQLDLQGGTPVAAIDAIAAALAERLTHTVGSSA